MTRDEREAIRARDAMFSHIPVERLATQSMVDRRALLQEVDRLTALLAECVPHVKDALEAAEAYDVIEEQVAYSDLLRRIEEVQPNE